MHVEGEGADPSALPAEASARARAVAERQAKSAVDRSGRQRIEERLAEVVIRNIRAQRNRARQARQAQRDGAARAAAAERALALARQATGRAPPAQQQQQQQQQGQQQQQQQGLGEDAWALEEPSSLPPTTPFDAASGGASAPVVAPSSAAPALGAALSSPLGSSDGAASGERRSGSVPAKLLPGGRVTINNLASLLNPPPPSGLATGDAAAGAHGAHAAAAPAPATAAAAAGNGAAPERAGTGGSSLSVAELAELLGKHAKLE